VQSWQFFLAGLFVLCSHLHAFSVRGRERRLCTWLPRYKSWRSRFGQTAGVWFFSLMGCVAAG
jgi:hypothetical protein